MEIAIGAALISTALRPLVDLAMEKVKAMVVDKVNGIVNIERDISNLQTTLCMIQDIVPVAEMMQIDDEFIRTWLRELNDVGYDARDVLEDFITFSSCTITAEEASKPVNTISSFMLNCFCGSSSDTSKLPLAVINQLAKDIKCVKERFDEMTKNGETFTKLKSAVGRVGSESVRVNCRPIFGPSTNKQGDNLVLGREEVKQEIMEKLLNPSDDNRVHVVAIWGMGGIGKTTLAQSIYNDERVKDDHYPTKNRRWLCVGESKFSAEKVIKEILNDEKTIGIGNLDTELQKKLRKDRFLIVLDDVWDVDDSEWSLLFNPLTHVGKGGLIIITKREKEVCPELIKIQTAYNLELLSEQDSWSLFESCAYKDGKSDSTRDLKHIGKEIVKKLNGLPLALRVVGCSLLEKDSNTWTNFLESNEWKLTNDDKVMSALSWSYNHLPRHLKMCFTYCALFPRDQVLDKKLLVQMWMAHDLIQKEKKKQPEDVGAQYFEELVNASLLQRVDGKYVMHDLIHDLAVLVSNGVITHVVSNGEFATANGSLSIDQMVRHITITLGDYSKIPRLSKIEKLLTLYTTARFHLDAVFKQLKSIRALVLESSKITDIPDCISELSHLRYLDVSKTAVKGLPESLCRLYNLQMIAAPHYAVLPRDVVNMVNLRYIKAILSTCERVGKLTSLQELSSIHVCEGDNIRELGVMQRLSGKFTISGLENVEKLEDDVGALMEKQTLMDELELEFNKQLEKSTISEEVLDALGCPPNLTCLQIIGYNGVKSPSWMVDTKHKFDKLQTLQLTFCPKLESLPPLRGFDKLQTLKLSNCPKLKSLPPLGGFDKLQSLELSFCPKLESLPPLGELTSLKHLSLLTVGVKRMGDEFYGKFTKGKVFFPSLESLKFSFLREWEEWNDIIIENSNVSFFSRLTSLRLLVCPKLKSLPPLGELTSLKDLCLNNVGVKRLGDEFYGNLTKSKVFFPSLESLSFIEMEEWEEWSDIIIENSRVSFFPRLTGLEIRGCAKLVSVLPVVKNPIMNAANFMKSLSHLKIWNCHGLKQLQLDALVSLKHLDICDCSSLVQITSAICLATTIERLRISCCKLLGKMDFERLPSLETLDITSCDKLISIPRLVVIKTLKLEGCESLRSLNINVHGLDSLEYLDIHGCPTLELSFEDGSSSSSSSGNSAAVPIQNIYTDNTQVFRTLLHHEIVSLEHLKISKLEGFENFGQTEANNFCKFRSLKNLLMHCKDLKSLPPDFPKLSSLERLSINSCPKLKSLPPDFHKLSSLKRLQIFNCPQLQSLPPDFHKLSSLEKLKIQYSYTQLQSLPPDFYKLSSLKSLKIEDSSQFISLPSDFYKLSSLEKLEIKYCTQLQSLPLDFHKLSSLEKLEIQYCTQLQSLPPDFHKLSSLEKLKIHSCTQLQSLPLDFHKLSSLKSLSIDHCPQLQSLPPDFHKLSSLEKLEIQYCTQLQSLPDGGLPLSLNWLTIEHCPLLFERCKDESGLD